MRHGGNDHELNVGDLGPLIGLVDLFGVSQIDVFRAGNKNVVIFLYFSIVFGFLVAPEIRAAIKNGTLEYMGIFTGNHT